MTKRLFTTERVLEAVLADDDDEMDYDDPNEPIMDGSDDEFSDLEFDEDDAVHDSPPPTSPLVASPLLSSLLTTSPMAQGSPDNTSLPSPFPSSPSSNVDPPSPPATWTSTLTPVEVKTFNSPVGPTTPVPETPREVFEMFFGDELMELMVTESTVFSLKYRTL